VIKLARPDHPRDGHERRISYLRLSVTDRCNLACRYCMPDGPPPRTARADLLTPAELLTLAEAAVGLGITKIRVTGGEPLVRPDLVALLGRLRDLPGLERLVLTTNGLRLAPLAADLRHAGVDGVNVSVDSLDPRRFAAVTGGGDLAACLAGVEAALAAGFTTKLNVVVMAGINDDEIERFAALALERPLAVRFIEHMPVGGPVPAPALTVPAEQVLARLARLGPLTAVDTGGRLAGPARMFRLADGPGTVGVIAGESCSFCSDCNRIRVTAAGQARGCLFQERPVDLRPHLRSGARDELAAALRALIAAKPEARAVACAGPHPQPLAAMSRIGG